MMELSMNLMVGFSIFVGVMLITISIFCLYLHSCVRCKFKRPQDILVDFPDNRAFTTQMGCCLVVLSANFARKKYVLIKNARLFGGAHAKLSAYHSNDTCVFCLEEFETKNEDVETTHEKEFETSCKADVKTSTEMALSTLQTTKEKEVPNFRQPTEKESTKNQAKEQRLLKKEDSSIENDSVIMLQCGHIYHRHCLNTWIRRKSQPFCPLCNRSVECENIFVGKYSALNLQYTTTNTPRATPTVAV